MKIRKQTQLWTQKDGSKIRICDMDDNHLRNVIKMLERYQQRLIYKGYNFVAGLNGEMAIDCTERELEEMENGDIGDIHSCGIALLMERQRRIYKWTFKRI